MAHKEQPLISVKDLCKSYDDDLVLNRVSVDVEEGDLVSIIGPSVCGKSTFLRCLNCLEVMDSGRISIAGLTLQRDKQYDRLSSTFHNTAHDLREQVGMVFQGLNLFPHMTILENIILSPMVVKKQTKAVAVDNAIRLLEKVGLKNFASRYPYSLSGGQQQRAAIARALAMMPKVMLYDEPTSSLDPELVEEVLQVMRAIDEEGMTQIVVTHEMAFAQDASDYIIYMEDGEIVEISDEDEIFVSPQDERTRRFLKKYL